MASSRPHAIDVTHYQFKIHDKLKLYNTRQEVKSNINLLASASAYGLIFVGNPFKPEIKVLQNQKLIESKEEDYKTPVRTVSLPNVPHNITSSCDDTLLAVNYTVQTSALIEIFDVKSFLSKNVVSKYKIPISTEPNVEALQILWNPVICSTFSVILSNGTLSSYNLRETSFEFNTAVKQEETKCACWSPKGKQLVVGFPNGKLVQYRQDLTVARIINCPTNLYGGPFNTIAVHWLSVYQFAVVLLEQGEDTCPALYIVNAPKTGNPIYISYGDICYSAPGPRSSQIFFKHIQPWNILLMASANSMEVGILGTIESGESPIWTQYIPPDEARIELPLNSEKQETYPIGFSLDTASTHQLTIGETKIPVMPMVHLLSTDGHLVSFNFLNLNENAPGICSPPQPISDTSGYNYFVPYDQGENQNEIQQPAPIAKSQSSTNVGLQMGITSTSVAQDQKSSGFGGNILQSKPLNSNATYGSATMFGNSQNIGSMFGNAGQLNFGTNTTMGTAGFGAKLGDSKSNNIPPASSAPVFGHQSGIAFGANVENKSTGVAGNKTFLQENQNQQIIKPSAQKFDDSSTPAKPLYMATQQIATTNIQQPVPKESQRAPEKDYLNMYEIGDILKEMIKNETQAFQIELDNQILKSKVVDSMMKNTNDAKCFLKQLNSLQTLSKQATETTESLAMDIHALRQSLTESFGMLAEVKSKLEMFKDPRISKLEIALPNLNQANQRQIMKFQSGISANEVQLQIVAQQIEALWASHQDRNDTKKKLHIPSLEIVYQTLSTYKDIVAREREKIKRLKTKLSDSSNDVQTIETLNDSLLSMSLHEKVQEEMSLLTSEKIKNLRNVLCNTKIMKTKTHRPSRTSLNTEVILEDKIKKVKQHPEKVKVEKKLITEGKKKSENLVSTKKTTEVQKMHPITPTTLPKSNIVPPQMSIIKIGSPRPLNVPSSQMSGIKIGSPRPLDVAATQPKTDVFAKPLPTNMFMGQKIESNSPSLEISFANPTELKKKENNNFIMPQVTIMPQLNSVIETKATADVPLPLKIPTANSNTPKTSSYEFSFSSFGINTQANDKQSIAKPSPLFGDTGLTADTNNPAVNTAKPAVTPTTINETSIFKLAPENTDSIFDSLKICKVSEAPKTTTAPPFSLGSNLFGSTVFGATSTADTKSIFGGSKPGTLPVFSTSALIVPTPTSAALFASSTPGTTVTQPAFGLSITSSLSTPTATSTATNLTKPNISFLTTSAPITLATNPSVFESVAVITASTTTPATITTTVTSPLFSFALATAATSTLPTTTSIFDKPTTTTTPQLNFGSFSISSTTNTTLATSTAPATITSSGNVFKEIPKPDQSVFETATSTAIPLPSSTTTTAAITSSPFDKVSTTSTPFGASNTSQTAASTGNVFGNQQSSIFTQSPGTTVGNAFASSAGTTTGTFGIQTPTTGTSVFGGTSVSQQPGIFGGGSLGTATSASSPFGAPLKTDNLFGTPATANQSTGGSLFSSSSFGNTGQTTGSVFGGATATSTQSTNFGSNLFGGSTAVGGQSSIFGGSATQSTFGNTGGFGATQPFGSAPAFGQTSTFGSTSPGGAFMQGGPSIAQTGFGSPGSPGGFAKPAFGGNQSFGGPPAFGAAPTFGGSPTFGSPKSPFGGFATTTAPGAFSPPTQKNNLFESLGSSDAGPSFGNLAQNAYAADSAKQQFGGSSFSSWR